MVKGVRAPALLNGQGLDGGGRPHEAVIGVCQGRHRTSIDRDFGRGDAWPNFVSMEGMDPVPMFVGDVDGARRHTVGAGLTLTPLELPRRRQRRTTGDEKDDDNDDDDNNRLKMISLLWVLRAGLLNSLLCELD